ncbi:Alpha/Beta hydrolase protein [Irpex rosettiformis]|uniref:Alpha/Beta hydrolase protein n=1 Tax=Irpex rosettiformis TaxID=378272 RepID=A0ACB8UL84_9APHY|nr:Alpha/Beta hydrolase protein [Irpex rosettiformis]
MPEQSPSMARTREQTQAVFPMLRWLTGKQSSSDHARTPTQSHPSTPIEYSDSPLNTLPPSRSDISALAEALDDDPRLLEAHSKVDMPSRPKAAKLPPQLRPWRPPSHLSDLSRATLPTSGLSPTTSFYSSAYTDPYDDPFSQPHNDDLDMFYSPTPNPVAIPHSPAPAHVNRSPPTLSPSSTRSSIETLRLIQDKGRGIHTTPPSQKLTLPAIPNPFSWFGVEDASQQKEIMGPSLSEEDRARTQQKQKEQIRQHYVSPKNPVVFCHGLLGFDTVTLGPSIAPLQVTHWRGIKDALEANGTEVLITRVPATSSPIDRAKVLEKKISEIYPGRSVHLIGHSMGGLDCRYLTTHLTDRKFKVLSITTIGSPHRGSSFADHFLSTVGIERMPSVLSLLDMLPNGGGDGKAFEFLTLENMRRFNEDTPDVPGVKYFSWGAVYEPGLIDTWKWSHSVILEKEGPNDGLVSLKSARWGTYLGTLEGVNHLDLVGWVNTARYKWAEIMGREIKFKPATFYLSVADHLARVVEGQGHEQSTDGEVGDVEGPETAEQAELRQEGERAEMAESLGKSGDDNRTPSPSPQETEILSNKQS